MFVLILKDLSVNLEVVTGSNIQQNIFIFLPWCDPSVYILIADCTFNTKSLPVACESTEATVYHVPVCILQHSRVY